MTKAERGALLRVRLEAVRGYYLPPHPKPSKPKEVPYVAPRTGGIRATESVGQHIRELPVEWVSKGFPETDKLAVGVRRLDRISPLTRIAEQVPTKLRRALGASSSTT